MINLKLSTFFLSLIFSAYLIFSFLGLFIFFENSNYIYVLLSFIISSIFFLLYLSKNKFYLPLNAKIIFLFALIFLFSTGAYLNSDAEFGKIYPLFFALYLSIFIFSFLIFDFNSNFIGKFLNIYFVFYVIISFVYYFFSLDVRKLENPYINVFNVLSGLEGSPADIDAFASIILIFNIIKSFTNIYNRIFVILLSVCVIILTGTMLPFFIFLIVVLSYLTTLIGLSNRLISITFIIAILIIFYLSQVFFIDELLVITNNRSLVWNEALLQYFTSANLADFIFGKPSASIVEISWGKGETNNPHNGFIFIMLRFGLVPLFMLLFFVVYFSKKLSNFKFLLMMSFVAASFSGVTFFAIGNPVYPFLIAWLVASSLKDSKINQFSHRQINT